MNNEANNLPHCYCAVDYINSLFLLLKAGLSNDNVSVKLDLAVSLNIIGLIAQQSHVYIVRASNLKV